MNKHTGIVTRILYNIKCILIITLAIKVTMIAMQFLLNYSYSNQNILYLNKICINMINIMYVNNKDVIFKLLVTKIVIITI